MGRILDAFTLALATGAAAVVIVGIVGLVLMLIQQRRKR
jgi:hypothetical protein